MKDDGENRYFLNHIDGRFYNTTTNVPQNYKDRIFVLAYCNNLCVKKIYPNRLDNKENYNFWKGVCYNE